MAVCCWCRSELVSAEGAYWCPERACYTRQADWAVSETQGKARRWLYVPTPKQAVFHETTRKVRRVLYGGQAGGAKSHGLRWGLYRDCQRIPNLNCLLLRRTFKQLESTHLLAMEREQKVIGAAYRSGDKRMEFPNGSIIQAGHCETTSDAMNYLSTEYDRIAFDELVTFDRDPSLEIMSRARTSKPEVLADGDAQVWAGSNPGGRGAMWVKEFFIDHAVDLSEFPSYTPERYGFVEAGLEDNPYISEQYRRDLEDLPEQRKRQLLEGDWNAFEGQFFSEWQTRRHVRSLEINGDIEHFASMDWGYNAPGVVLWWACLPDGRFHIRAEYKFRGMDPYEVGKEIRKRTADLKIRTLRYVAADPAMWQKTGAGKGESIAETLLRTRIPMRRSDNDRFNGWNRVHALLRGEEPFLTVDPGCRYLIRTLPAMVQDDNDPEDVDTTQEDHAVDAVRYGAMSRPSPTRMDKKEMPGPGTWGYETARQDAAATRGRQVIA